MASIASPSKLPVQRVARRGALFVLLACCAAPLFAAPARAQLAEDRDNKGRDFYMAFMPNNGGGQNVQVHLTADVATQVTVQYPAIAPFLLDTQVNVGPGQITVVSLPTQAASSWPSAQVSNNLVHAFASREFVAYMINLQSATSDAALALPVDVLDTDYVVIDRTQSSTARFTVFAAFDDTQVTITPTTGISGGPPAVTPFVITLNRGQAYHALSASGSVSFVGTRISANRPIGLSNGSNCTVMPGAGGSGACDHIFEVAQPVQTWGTEIPVANLPQRVFGSIYQVVAAEADTDVLLDGAPLGTIAAAGGVLDVSNATLPGNEDLIGNHVFSADKPIFVVQYLTGAPGQPPTDGDPAMGNMIPSAQYLNEYTFATPGAGQFALHFLTVIARAADLDSLQLDGTPIKDRAGFPGWNAIAGTDLSATVVSIAEGTHSTNSRLPHGITVEGFGTFDSYLYPGGARFGFINTTDANPPLCSLVPDLELPDRFVGNGRDDRPSEDTNGNGEIDPGEDLNQNGIIDVDTGISSVVLGAGAVNLSLAVDPGFLPGEPTVAFTLQPANAQLPFSGDVVVSDLAGNTCTRSVGADGGDPFTLFETTDWAEAVDVFVDDEAERSFAFLAAQTDGVYVLETTDPLEVTVLGQYRPVSCSADGIQVLFFADDVEFVEDQMALHVAAGPCGVHVVDVSGMGDPGFMPEQISVYDTPVWAEEVVVAPNGDATIAYVADYDALRIYDVSDPENPSALGSLDESDEEFGDGPVLAVDVAEISEDLLALVAVADGLRVVDVDDPEAPSVRSSYSSPPGGSGPSVSQDIIYDAELGTVLLPIWAGGFQVVDLLEPSEPFELDTFPTPVAFFSAAAFDGRYYAAEGTEGLHAFELVEGVLEDLGSLPLSDPTVWAWDVVVADCVAYVTFGRLGPGDGGLEAIPLPDCDVSTPLENASDTDDDTIPDDADNCILVANGSQLDSDADGYGNACDADTTNDGIVGVPDYLALVSRIGAVVASSSPDAVYDNTGDGVVGVPDYLVFVDQLGGAPGPSGLAP